MIAPARLASVWAGFVGVFLFMENVGEFGERKGVELRWERLYNYNIKNKGGLKNGLIHRTSWVKKANCEY